MATTLVLNKTETQAVTEVQSLSLIKNLMRVGVSTICYLRAIFPEDCFQSRDYIDMKTHTLEPHYLDENGALVVLNQEAHMLGKWLESGVFMALRKKYLRSLVFAIVVNEMGRERVLETYTWKITYPGGDYAINGVSFKDLTKDGLKRQAVALIRALISFTQTLPTLPEERCLSMKLLYYDDVTPEDYQPELFHDCAADALSLNDDRSCLRIRLGSVATPHHTMDVRFAGRSDGADAGLTSSNDNNLWRMSGLSSQLSDAPQSTPAPIDMHTDAPDDATEVASKEPVNSTNRLADAFGRTTIQEGTQAQQDGLSKDMLEKVKTEVLTHIHATYISVPRVAQAVQLDVATAKQACHKLAEIGVLQSKPWGNKTRFTLNHAQSQPKLETPPPTAAQQQQQSSKRERSSEDDGGEDDDSDDATVRQEDYEGLSQQSVYKPGRKCSRTDPLIQTRKKPRS